MQHVSVDYLTCPKTTYYEWLGRFSKFTYVGLKDKEKSKPRMPNNIKLDIELIIYNYITNYLTHGLKENRQ